MNFFLPLTRGEHPLSRLMVMRENKTTRTCACEQVKLARTRSSFCKETEYYILLPEQSYICVRLKSDMTERPMGKTISENVLSVNQKLLLNSCVIRISEHKYSTSLYNNSMNLSINVCREFTLVLSGVKIPNRKRVCTY